MSDIKINNGEEWKVAASGKASGVAVTAPELLNEGETVISTEEALLRQNEKITKLERNVSWLAKNGGGGAGGGGGIGGGSVLACEITVNGSASGEDVIMDNSGIRIDLNGITTNTNAFKNWTVTVNIGSINVVTTTASFTRPYVNVSASRISQNLTNFRGNLFISASYQDDLNGVFGGATWSGTIIESRVTLTTAQSLQTFTYDEVKNGNVNYNYNYSVGLLGDYDLSIKVSKSGNPVNTVVYPLSISSSAPAVRSVNFKSLIEDAIDVSDERSAQGSYRVEATLFNKENPNIAATNITTITISSTTIFISSSNLSQDPENPTLINVAGSIQVTFAAYLMNVSMFDYKYLLSDAYEGTDYDSVAANILIRDAAKGIFGEEVSNYVSVNNKPWAVPDTLHKFVIKVWVGDENSAAQTSTESFWIKFIESEDDYLTEDTNARNHTLTSFNAGEWNEEVQDMNFVNDNYDIGGSITSITSDLTIKNPNSLSCIREDVFGNPSLRVSNGAYGILSGWKYNNLPYTAGSLVSGKSFSISLCFKADYHPDDNRTILFSGQTSASVGQEGTLTTGISIDVHDVYINGSSVVKLTDNTINSVDIVVKQVQVTNDNKDSSGNVTSQTTNTSYLIKVFLDGVLTSVSTSTSPLNLGNNMVIGARLYGVNNTPTYLCDCNIYSLRFYDTDLSDLDIMINYINNKIATSYKDKVPGYGIIDDELKKNFCERGEGNTVISRLYRNNAYTIDFLLDERGKLSEENLTTYAKILGIPVMMIDVSTDPNWTFNNFVRQQTSGSVDLSASDNRDIYYWDPEGSNTKVIEIHEATIDLQGTSTLSDVVKNINITVPDTTAFIPKETWFPEQTYTLKADVVDSSHSNNAAIGKFINTVFGYIEPQFDEEGNAIENPYGAADSTFFPFDQTAHDNVYKSDYKKNQQKSVTLKHTVEGFPIFLIMKFNTTETSKVSTSPLGIYSFNIGRDAYRNLGFKKLNKILLPGESTPSPITSFPFIAENCTFDETDSNANWIEISDTTSLKSVIDMKLETLENSAGELNLQPTFPANFDSSEGDFWQNDDNILNYRYEVRYPKGRRVSDYPIFKNFVSNIMKLPVEGIFSSPSVINSSTDVSRQRITGSYTRYTRNSENKYIPLSQNQSIELDTNQYPDNLGFNNDSVQKYFVIALLFGLVDNFGKNSTYRAWGNQSGSDSDNNDCGDIRYYIDFYDMDTALGSSNQGELSVTPDCWIKFLFNKKSKNEDYGYLTETFDPDVAKDSNGSLSQVSSPHSKLWMSIDTVTYRTLVGEVYNGVKSAFTYHWYELRKKLDECAIKFGYSNFVDWFIEDFYLNQTKQCGPLIFNYDYKLKYLNQFTPEDENNVLTRSLSKLHGRKAAYSKDWLKKHVLFLDSVFRWRDNTLPIGGFKNNISAAGSNTVDRTPKSFPITTNTPLCVWYSVGNTVQTFVFAQRNTDTYLNTINSASTGTLNWNLSFSPNIIKFGNAEHPLGDMNVRTLSFSPYENSLDQQGYPAITELNLTGDRVLDGSFGAAGGMNAFKQTFVSDPTSTSELRSLIFRNTNVSNNSSQFSLDLNENGNTPYKKLTKIDISGSSAINNITIPNVPLQELIIRGSKVLEFNLVNQKYIENVDLTGCTSLNTINLSGCSAYKELVISDLTDISSVTVNDCSNISKVSIKNCPNLISVNIESCDNIKEIVVNNCPGLTNNSPSRVVIVSCPNLESIDLSDNENLEGFQYTNINESGIKTLKLHNTKIKNLWKELKQPTGDAADILDLFDFESLTNFSIYKNPVIKYIQFANPSDTKFVTVSNHFQDCPLLERIYGNILFSNAVNGSNWGSFRGCSRFTLHGPNTYTGAQLWKGVSVVDGTRVKTPWEVIVGSKITDTTNLSTYVWGALWQSGKGVTNLKLVPTNGNQGNYTFAGTALTQFDVYYYLTAFALSNMTANCGFTDTFSGLNKFSTDHQGCFDWSKGSEPDRNMFYKCSRITSLTRTFTSTGNIILYSPDINGGKDNGLFSPLTQLGSITAPFSTNAVISKNLFRRVGESNYPLTYLSWFYVSLVIDEDSMAPNYSTIYNSSGSIQNSLLNNVDKIGNFDNFWKNIPSLQSIHTAFTSVWGINYGSNDTDEKGLSFLNSISSINNSFHSTYAKGELKLEKMFKSGSNLVGIANCFTASGKLGNAVDPQGYGSGAKFIVSTETFKNIPRLVYFGWNPGDADSYSSKTSNCCYGGGIKKVFSSSTSAFPYTIFNNLPNLETAAGFFKGIGFEEGRSFSSTPAIPGQLFQNNRNLKNVPCLFEDINWNFSLTSNGFQNCPNLTNVSRMFYHTVSKDTNGRGTMTGYIPYRLFYHGSSPVSSKTVYGKNDGDSLPIDIPTDLSTLLNQNIDVQTVFSNIEDISYCFYGQMDITPYTNVASVSDFEINNDYTPFKWMYDVGTQTWSTGTSTGTPSYQRDASWSYNGDPSKIIAGYRYLDNMLDVTTDNLNINKESNSINYLCAPDLFRYCKNASSTNIRGVFKYCGYDFRQYGSTTNGSNLYERGIYGRIPPYLLYPLSNVTAIDELFRYCRRISAYRESSGGNIFLIPNDFFSETPNISSLQNAFSGLSFNIGTNLNVFSFLRAQGVDIRGILSACVWGVDNQAGSTWTVANLFESVKLGRISGAFTTWEVYMSDVAGGVTLADPMSGRNVYNGASFPSGVMFSNNFGSKIPSDPWYVYRSIPTANVNDSIIPSINSNY